MTYVYNGTRRLVRVTPEPAGPWLQTLGGGRLDLVNPKPEQINPRHVVRVLARIPRFGGHTDHPYSVLQHSHEGARAILRDTGRKDAADAFRWHDGHEAYIGDMPTPVQDALVALAGGPNGSGWHVKSAIKEAKRRLDAAIYSAVGIPYPLQADVAAIVHEYDLRMCRTERDARLGDPVEGWAQDYPAIHFAEPVAGCDLYPYSPGTVESLFLESIDNPDLWG